MITKFVSKTAGNIGDAGGGGGVQKSTLKSYQTSMLVKSKRYDGDGVLLNLMSLLSCVVKKMRWWTKTISCLLAWWWPRHYVWFDYLATLICAQSLCGGGELSRLSLLIAPMLLLCKQAISFRGGKSMKMVFKQWLKCFDFRDWKWKNNEELVIKTCRTLCDGKREILI